MRTVIGAVAFAVLLLFAIFFHELGHFVTARWAKIKIRQFFVGFGPTIWSYRRGRTEVVEDPSGRLIERPETEYGVKALPLGGFVKVVGMSPLEDVPPQDLPRSFQAAPAWKRAIVLAAGSVTHVLTAFVVLVLIYSVIGIEDPERATLEIAAVQTEVDGRPSPAVEAGLDPGDRIVAIGHVPVTSWDRLRSIIRRSAGETLHIDVREPDGEVRTVEIVPAAATDEDGNRIGIVGVTPTFEVSRVGPITGAGRSVIVIGSMFKDFIRTAPEAFAPANLGILPGTGDRRTALSVVGAGRIAANVAARGQIRTFLIFFVQINLFISLMNMLPLPPLDGGHLLVLAIEKIRRKPVDQRVLVPVMAIVTSLLLVLMVVLVFQDIVRPVTDPFQ